MERERGSVDDLVSLIHQGEEFNPANPEHRRAVSRAMQNLGFCCDAMTLLLQFLKGIGPEGHTGTWEGFNIADRE